MSPQSEARRRMSATAAAIVLCLVVTGLVAAGLQSLSVAYRIQRAQAQGAVDTLVPPPAASADSAVGPVPVPRQPAALPPRLSHAQALAVVRSTAFPYRRTVLRAAARHAVDPALVFAIIASESRGDPEAVSPAGAIGLMQLMPSTAVELGVDPWKPDENIEGAVRYLSVLLEQFKSVDLSLVAYNAGPGFAERYRQGEVDLGAETRAFIMRVAERQ